MRELYNKVEEIINRIDFDSIWHGFSKFAFVLYDKDNVYFYNEVIPYDRRFLGNSSIEYNGEYIAIWNVENPSLEDPEVLASNLVHEMFHAFQGEQQRQSKQQTNHESHSQNDLLFLDYPDSTENYTVKYSENLLLTKAFLAEDMPVKKALLKQFISARKYREKLIGDIIRLEYNTETNEGIAEYAGSMALKQISPTKYQQRMDEYVKKLHALDNSFFHIRRILYYSGTLFCITLSDAGMDFHYNVGDTEFSLFDFAAEKAEPEKPLIDFDPTLLSTEIERYICEKKRKFEDFLLSHNEEITGKFIICGYDPMNMIKMSDSILCSHFIALKGKEDDSHLFIQGPVMVNLKSGTANEVKSYIK